MIGLPFFLMLSPDSNLDTMNLDTVQFQISGTNWQNQKMCHVIGAQNEDPKTKIRMFVVSSMVVTRQMLAKR